MSGTGERLDVPAGCPVNGQLVRLYVRPRTPHLSAPSHMTLPPGNGVPGGSVPALGSVAFDLAARVVARADADRRGVRNLERLRLTTEGEVCLVGLVLGVPAPAFDV